ncbi:MAG: hypothetical protein ABSE93_10115 [Terriglobia bacterium]
MKTEFHPEAYEEMRESARYYEESKIYIAAVMHQHRRPGFWKDRVRD